VGGDGHERVLQVRIVLGRVRVVDVQVDLRSLFCKNLHKNELHRFLIKNKAIYKCIKAYFYIILLIDRHNKT
jgi:hypothetical protein